IVLRAALAREPFPRLEDLPVQELLPPGRRRDGVRRISRAEEHGAGHSRAGALSRARIRGGESALQYDARFPRGVPDRPAVRYLDGDRFHFESDFGHRAALQAEAASPQEALLQLLDES